MKLSLELEISLEDRSRNFKLNNTDQMPVLKDILSQEEKIILSLFLLQKLKT